MTENSVLIEMYVAFKIHGNDIDARCTLHVARGGVRHSFSTNCSSV